MSIQENPKQQESIEVQLNRFRAEMAELKRQEEQKMRPTSHFKNIDPYELGVYDMDIWEKVKDGSVTGENIEEYTDLLMEKPKPLETAKTPGTTEPFRPVFRKPREGISRSRIDFSAFINNVSGPIINKRLLEELRKKKQGG